jgi:hypothetical protein
MVFRLGLCRNGMGAEWEMRFVAYAENSGSALTTVELRSTWTVQRPASKWAVELPGCGKQVDIL